jgi:hypothetical protein
MNASGSMLLTVAVERRSGRKAGTLRRRNGVTSGAAVRKGGRLAVEEARVVELRE